MPLLRGSTIYKNRKLRQELKQKFLPDFILVDLQMASADWKLK